MNVYCFLIAILSHCNSFDREKSSLLAALKSKGFHIISTPEQLLADLPGRSLAEIAALINMYKIKKPVRCTNVEQQAVAVLHANSDSGSGASTPPIESWYRIIHNNMNSRCKRDDLSAVLSDVMMSIASEADDGSNSHLSNVYAYLSECLAGKCPRELSVEESVIIVNLLEQLRSAVDEGDDAAERSFLSGGSWWEKNGNEDDASPSPLRQTSSSEAASCCSAETRAAESPMLQQFLTSCLEFSKIKRISRCLNPLLVPVSMLMQRQQQLLKQEHGTNNRQ